MTAIRSPCIFILVTTTTIPQTFQEGQTVSCTSACDSECVWTFEIIRRSAKFITLQDLRTRETYRVGIRVHDDEEWASPFGSYSMAPVVRAGA